MSALSRRNAWVAGVVVLALVASTLVWFATRAQGEVIRKTDLNDGGVWVTNSHASWFGRLNKPARQLDAGIFGNVAEDSGIDVLQDGQAVVGIGRAANQLLPIDPERAQLASSTGVPLPKEAPATGNRVFVPARADLRGGTIAVVDPATGKVWAQRVDPARGVESLEALAPTSKPLAEVGGVAAVAVGEDGTVYAVSAGKGRLVTLTPDGHAADGFAKPVYTDLGFTSKAVDVTAVGDRYVVFDPFSGLLRVEGVQKPIESGLPQGEGQPVYAALQQPGPAAHGVLVEGPTAAQQIAFGDEPAGGGVEVADPAVDDQHPLMVSRPVRLGPCVHAAWAGHDRDYYGRNCGEQEAQKAYTITHLGEGNRVDGVALRVNRHLIVLNDLDTGDVFDIDDNPLKIDDWTSVIPPPKIKDKNDKKDRNLIDDRAVQRPPKANPDQLKVRPGRISTLHVLDNDTDSRGQVLAIAPGDVTRPDAGDVSAQVSGDGQAIELDVPEHPSSQVIHFRYTVNNGSAKKNADSTTDVTVTVVDEGVNTPPRLRRGHAKLAGTTYPATRGENLNIGLAADWRDAESDPVSVEAVDGDTSVDGGGRLSLTAPDKPGTSRVAYAVSDGHGGTTQGEVAVKVLADNDRLVPPKTQPDVVRAVAGKPVQVEPLGNDIPGADPAEAGATMRLASDLRATGGVTVDTVLDTGVVTITGTSPGTYSLSYAAQVGGGTSVGKIRVDVLPAPDSSTKPVAVPDNTVVRDQLPALTDVLANDYSPRSDVLVTQQVRSDASWLRASVVKGRWVRVESTEPFRGSQPRHGILHYTINDGTHSAQGEVDVTQKAPPKSSVRPVVEDDRAVVRRGDSVTIPVLDNDSMSGGIPLRLDPRSVKVISGGGQAFASGNVLRYVPKPSRSKVQTQAVLEYATYPDGLQERAVSGRVNVTVTPPPTPSQPDQAPVARRFTASVTAGDSLTITVPTTGIDPDGDSVTVDGLVGQDGEAVGLRLGRVTSVGAATIHYEAYPRSHGTDVIRYRVRDRYGQTSEGFVRVGVVPPSDPQPPVAVQDEVVAQPGRSVNADVLQNDLISPGDVVSFEDWKKLNGPETRHRFKAEKDHTLTAKVPPEGQPLAVTYGITDGMFDPSRTTLLVRGQKNFINPPVAQDDVAKFTPRERTTTVDVLENDHDIDGPESSLRIVEVLDKSAKVVGDKVRVRAKDHPYTVPYVIEDVDGAQAIALIYVPTGEDGTPYVTPGKVIRIDPDSTLTVDLGDYVTDPGGRDLHVTSPDTISTSPGDDLEARATAKDTLELTSRNHYTGPGALMLEVATTVGPKGKQKQRSAYVSIPVQVGPLAPVLRCPSSYEIKVVADGPARRVDIPRLCHAWVPAGLSLDDVDFTASWKKAPDDVDLRQEGPGGRVAVVQAQEDAPGGRATLSVGAEGTDQSFDISVVVQGLQRPEPQPASAGKKKQRKPEFVAPDPTMRPITVSGLKAGDSRMVDVAHYLDSPLKDPVCRILRMGTAPGSGVTTTHSGCRLTVHAAGTAHGTSRLPITVSDGPHRSARGSVTVTVRGRPSAPTGVRAVADRKQGSSARVWWAVPKSDGGLPVQYYTVTWRGGGHQRCTASPCTIDHLQNGHHYRFRVTAHNAAGNSPASTASNTVTPDKRPEAVTGVHRTGRGDHYVTVAWPRPRNDGSAITAYRVRWTNLGSHPGTHSRTVKGRTARLNNLVNDDEYRVQVQAHNGAGWGSYGPARTVQSVGTPPRMAAPTLTPQTPTPQSGTGRVQISWKPVRPNGPDLVRYTVYRSVGGGAFTVLGTTSPDTRHLADTMPYNGVRYRYAVTATNGGGKTSPRSASTAYVANGIPQAPRAPSVTTPSANERATVRIHLGDSRSRGFTALTWQTSGGSGGSWGCACGDGSTVTRTTTGLATSSSQRLRVRARNSAGDWSAWSAWSNSFRAYGDTPSPAARATSTNGNTLTFHWSPRTNGRPVTGYQIKGVGATTKTSWSHTYGDHSPTTHKIQVREHTVAGWGPYTTLSGRTSPPVPTIYNVHKSKGRYVDPNGSGICRTSGCPKVLFSIKNFPPNTSWHVHITDNEGGLDKARPITVNGRGNGYDWGGDFILISDGHKWLRVELSRGGKTYYSATTPW